MGSFLEVEVFRAGDYGAKGLYGAEELDALCGDYTASLHEAPVTVDHAQSGPAFGWVHSLARRGDVLVATLKDLGEEFLTLIRAGAFRKRSIEIYRNFKATGRPYLRAISFLGACPPEVKGLADPVFSEQSEYESYRFDDEKGDEERGDTERRDTGKEKGETRGCEGTDDGAKSGADEETAATAAHSSPSGEVALLNEQKDRLQSEVAVMEAEARRERVARCCQRLIEEGRIVPAWERAGIAEFMMALGEEAARPEAQALKEKSGLAPMEWFESFLQTLPAIAPMSEAAAAPSGKAMFAESTLPSPGSAAPVSSASIGLHQRALALRGSDSRLSYVDALCQAARQA